MSRFKTDQPLPPCGWRVVEPAPLSPGGSSHSRASSDIYNAWATFPFLELPGEIRNKIYELVIPRSHVLVSGSHPKKEFQRSQKYSLNPMRKAPRYRLSGRILTIDDPYADPLGLLRTCVQVNWEATPLFYSKTTICFHDLKTIHKFLNAAPPLGLNDVRSLSLAISTYGEPQLTQDCKWKQKHDQKWYNTCWRLAESLPKLQRLKLDLRLATWPTQLSVNADWTAPLMRLKKNGLHRVRLALRHYRFNESRLSMAARKLEDSMMTEEGRDERDLREALQAVREMELERARKESLPLRARKILVIKEQPKPNSQETTQETYSTTKEKPADSKKNKKKPATTKKKKKRQRVAQDKQASTKDSDKQLNTKTATTQAKQTTTPVTYYRTKGLADFHRVDLNMVGVAWVG